ncbi:MAG: adenylosuccinate synthetase [Thermoproteota archaeon]
MSAYLALRDRPAISVRTGSINAGHTVVVSGKTYKLRLTPSAFVCESTRLMIAPGANISLEVFFKEIESLGLKNRLRVDYNASIIEEKHIKQDREDSFLKEIIGSTGSGVGPAIADRVLRKAKLAKDIPELKDFLVDVSEEVNNALDEGKVVHLEGSQGFYLSLYHGTYPYVTGRDTTAAAVLSEVGVGPKRVDEVILVLKGYVTRVGNGPLPGELPPEEIEKRGWVERGTVTGRVRRAAPFNFELAAKSARVNSATSIAITKIDRLFPECSHVRQREALSDRCIEFISQVEKATGVPVKLVGTGEDILDIVEL